MKKFKIFSFFILILLASCQREMDEYYELPAWLKGNAYEVLEKRGNFTMFLDAVDKSSFKDLVQGKGIVTVVAPTNEAFEAYLIKIGKTSVESLSIEELDRLVGYHLIYYSFNKENFMNYRPDGYDNQDENSAATPGTYYKFRTKSRDAISTMIDHAYEGEERKVMHKERFIPVLSTNFFKMKEVANVKAEYEALYPGSHWTVEGEGFNISNASVLEYEIITDNGYLYIVDQVLEPLETIYTELADPSSNYTEFAKAYDRFVTYMYDVDATRDYGKGDSLFVHSHISLPSIASEWTNLTNSTIPDYAQMTSLSSRAYNVIAPDNGSFKTFFNEFWGSYYNDIEDVNYFALNRLVNNHVVNTSSLLLPSEVSTWVNFRDIADGQTDATLDMTSMCVNGVLYGLKNNIMVPDVFYSPAAPALQNPDYSLMLLSLSRGGALNYFSWANEQNFRIFYPTNTMVKRSAYEGRSFLHLPGNPHVFGDEVLQIDSEDGFRNMRTAEYLGFASAHIVSEKEMATRIENGITETIYKTLNDFEYLYQVDDQIYSSAYWNRRAELSAPKIEPIALDGKTRGGSAYKLLESSEGTLALSAESTNFKDIANLPDKRPADYNGLSVYLNMTTVSKPVGTDPAFKFLLSSGKFIVLIPSLEAVLADLGSTRRFPIAGTPDQQDEYVKSLFIDVEGSSLLDYPFVGSMNKRETELKTYGKDINVTLIDNGDELILRDKKGNEAKILYYFPDIYADGAVYLIDNVLDLMN